jgi:hypothetical protein
MNACDEYNVKTLRYLDDDLQGPELIDFRNHLKACAECRASLEAEQALSYLLHRSRPLYLAPAALRSRVSAAVMQHSESELGRAGFYHGALQMLERELVHPAPTPFKHESAGVCGSPSGVTLPIHPECSAPGARRELR